MGTPTSIERDSRLTGVSGWMSGEIWEVRHLSSCCPLGPCSPQAPGAPSGGWSLGGCWCVVGLKLKAAAFHRALA